MIQTNKPIMVGRVSRINWGAIIAGGLLALSVSLLLNLLGLGFGFSAVDPLHDDQPLKGIGTGSIIWLVLSNLISVFAGAWVAGRFAGFVDNKDGGLHGIMTWALYTFVSLIFLTSAVSGIVSGLGNKIFGNSNSTKVVVNNDFNTTNQNDNTSIALDDVKSKAINYLTKAENLNLIPETISAETKAKIKNSNLDFEKMIKDLHLDEKVMNYVKGLEYNVDDNGKITIKANNDLIPENDVEIKEYIAKNTQLSEQEIEDISKNLRSELNSVKVKAEKYANEAVVKSKEYAQTATDALAKFAIYSFFALLIGLIISYFAGAMASPKHIVEAVEQKK